MAVRALRGIVISALTRVEVPAALWAKHRLGRLSSRGAAALEDAFAFDCRRKFGVVALTHALLERAATLVAIHPLKAGGALQLASALAARDADRTLVELACFDERLLAAAEAEGFRRAV